MKIRMKIMDIVLALFGAAPVTVIVLYPFYVKKYHKHRYKGMVKRMGDTYGTPAKAIRIPIGAFIGFLIATML